MNQLSQLLYLGNVAGNLGGFFVFFGIILAVFCGVMIITTLLELDSMQKYGINNVKAIKNAKTSRGLATFAISGVFVLWLLAALCPSQETVYAIAASEMGGRVLNSQTGNLAEQALNSWLKRQIAPPAAN